MLKSRIIELINRYESGEEYLSAYDIQEELEDILEDEEYDNELSPKLDDAISAFILQRHEAERGGGRIPDGGDEFIAEIERLIGY